MLSPVAEASLDSLLTRWALERDLSGTVLLTHAGSSVFERCYGLADRAAGIPIKPDTRFGLASVTKLFTAFAVADCVSAGLLRFGDAVVDVLPPERRPATLRRDVTVHHLLTHSSGIADYAEEDEESPGYVENYGELWGERPSYSMLRPADFLPLFGDRPPYRPPGQRWQYSNAAYIVLSLVIEEVSGQQYVDFVQERVFDRAGMSSSGFFRLDEARPNVAIGYMPRPSPDAPWRSNIYRVPVIGGGDGGAFSTACATESSAPKESAWRGRMEEALRSHTRSRSSIQNLPDAGPLFWGRSAGADLSINGARMEPRPDLPDLASHS